MATKTMLLNGTKSIPLSALTSEMWMSMLGGSADNSTPSAVYQSVPWVYAPVNLIANASGSLPLRWLNAQGEAIDAPEVAWAQSFGDLLNAVAGDLVLYGAAYVFRGNNARGVPTQLRRLLPVTIKPEVDAAKGLTHFTRSVNGSQKRLELKDVIYIWEPNRTGEIGPGTSRVHAALAAAGALANMDTATEIMFRNGAIRPTLVAFEGLAQEAERERVQGWLDRAVSGIRNAFRPLAVGTTITPTTLGDKPSELTMPELTDSKRQDIATALGVPHTLLFSNASNYATAQQDTLNFYDLTIIPLVMRALSAFNSQCFEAFGFTAETAENELEFYQQMQGDQVQALSLMFGQRVITVNEFRERVGFAPLEDPVVEDAPPDDSEANDNPVEALPEPADNQADPQRAELRAWARFASKRLKDGRPLRAFETAAIPPTLKAAIEGQLEAAADAAAVRAVFDHAERFAGYP